jgi:hypothetical protein
MSSRTRGDTTERHESACSKEVQPERPKNYKPKYDFDSASHPRDKDYIPWGLSPIWVIEAARKIVFQSRDPAVRHDSANSN